MSVGPQTGALLAPRGFILPFFSFHKSLAALLSVENIFYTPNAAREKASAARRKFLSREGDHATLLSTFRSHQRVKGAKQWCYDNFINVRSMKTVLATRDQVGRRRMVPGAILGL